mmetsp:Transcript_31411/g.70604  ORF Transcript_31411/g.70604 Transcript_31411/m.70604 type:complete len:516 (+) Transcript_31411:226-1773(+)|eukprot:CAMPEP_0172589470 /NCGR_PEP_ID=MMETSP1068-20121228/8190_1 /TAXON_ID=35684 /ORGANISM="Pseudopedinella elastica, Strain CCMP716" /LENGTH=515 /DNA_ID=CAMNT_0013385077 /DNA_START=147 /DNA_END=1694 /DNA_ORIENTATION=-
MRGIALTRLCVILVSVLLRFQVRATPAAPNPTPELPTVERTYVINEEQLHAAVLLNSQTWSASPKSPGAAKYHEQIELLSDIYLERTVNIYNTTGVFIRGNLFKLDGQATLRAFYLGHRLPAYHVGTGREEPHTFLPTVVYMEDLVITNCKDAYDGGALFVYGNTNLTMVTCVIKNSYAGNTGGAFAVQYFAFVDLIGCSLSGNVAAGEGDDVYLTDASRFSTSPCPGGDASSSYLDCGISTDDVSIYGGTGCQNTYESFVCSSFAPTMVPTQPTNLPTQPSHAPTFEYPTQVPTPSPTYAGPLLNISICPKFPLPRPDTLTDQGHETCEVRKPNFNVHNSREIGVFPTFLEGRDYFYAHPLRLFKTIEVHSQTGKDIKAAYVRFEDATGDGVADYNSGDFLYFYDTENIKGIYSKGAGTLRIKGRDSPSAYQEVLREIGYRASEFNFLKLLSAGDQIPRNVSIQVMDVQGYQSETIIREFEVLGSARMYTENAIGRIVCISNPCGGTGTYVRQG